MATPTNYTALATCAAIGSNFAISLPATLGRVEIPLLSTVEVQLHLGGNADWEQRRAFEWGKLATVFHRNGDEATADYCWSRVRNLVERDLTEDE